jgi:SAM-dependent methyltransferase
MVDPVLVDAWEREYQNGRYLHEPPVSFINDIVAAARVHRLGSAPGLYVGCGNGRNYLPLVAQGLDLLGLDLSPTALAQLRERAPSRSSRLLCGDLTTLAPGDRYAIVIAIQSLQHGNEATAHRRLTSVLERVAPGGLFCLRVNAVGTEVEYAHEVIERGGDGRFTVRYEEGPKRDLEVHFFTGAELREAIEQEFVPVLSLRTATMRRSPPRAGKWVQWEGIWRRNPASDGRVPSTRGTSDR